MDSKSLQLRRIIGSVVPASIDRAKRFAKQVNRNYPSLSLAQCQEATAHVFGHADWHTLDKQIKLGGKNSLHDEEIDDTHRYQRYIAQHYHLALDMAGVDPDEPYSPPEIDKSIAAIVAPHINMNARLEKAAMRFHRLLCEGIIWELRPTATEARDMWEVEKTSLETASQDMMKELPRLIGQWWKRNISNQTEVGQAIETFEWNKDRPTSVLKFGGYWGELSMHYASTIDWTMVIGTAHLLAAQYAAIRLQRTQVFHDAIGEGTSLGNFIFDARVVKLHRSFVIDFLSAYPRDDMIYTVDEGGKENTEEVIQILKSKRSRKGIWKNG